ncbi:MAG: alkyldihydroxyacetonephosphate synthase, partial [Solirubrobacteraceae bacterium]|nr:alkyldihydroxyacetonephosphate synthase [Solirubrobacteraceae bacterium]
MARREQVFWGWGEPGAGPALPEHALPWLRELGVSGDVVLPPPASLRLPPPALPEAARARLGDIAGPENVRDDDAARTLRAAGKSYLDLLAMRSGTVDEAPDAVVAPA